MPPKHLKMELPVVEPQPDGENSVEMVDRVDRWNHDFMASARTALRAQGYRTAEVKDFRCLKGEPGHDENDYELTVQVGSPNGKIGSTVPSMVKIVVRRAPSDALQSG